MTSEQASVTLGVLADTHIPDRSSGLPQGLLERFRQAGVAAILHAGDVCVPEVLEALGEIAPVHAVRGNRDIFYLRSLPIRLELEFLGVSIGLVHGHGSLRNYIQDRLRYYLGGVQVKVYRRRALQAFPVTQVVVFGHIHRPINEWVEGQLLFNPGSACCPEKPLSAPSAGLLHINAGGQVSGEIFSLG
jgi:putative phosphoesterase